ncbi:MAG: transglutaminaseTgpA domain-containing protein [Fuerstiella sp.]|nr:transglutaminaseTgpA domain-containing protein [Fuerstiella sp.]
MNSYREIRYCFLTAITLTVCGASVVLLLAEGAWFPVGLTPIFALGALWLNEWKQWLVLPTLAASFCGLAALCTASAELILNTQETRLICGAHLSVYLTWVVLFMRKQNRQYWWLMALSVVQLAISCVYTKAPYLGMSLVGMKLIMVWTLAVFTLLRLKTRTESKQDFLESATQPPSYDSTVVVRHGIQADVGIRWIGTRFRLMLLTMCLASLLMSGVVFAVFPRVFIGTPAFLNNLSISNNGVVQRTGFREQVKLGEFGSLLKSEERVLQVTAVNPTTGNQLTMQEVADYLEMDELMFRGNAMGWYAEGTWNRGLTANNYSSEFIRQQLEDNTSPIDCVRLEITQETPVGTFAFVPTPVVSARLLNTRGRLKQRSLTESLTFELHGHFTPRDGTSSTDINSNGVSFEVYCEPPSTYFEPVPPDVITGSLRQWIFPTARSIRSNQNGNRFAKSLAITRDLVGIVPKTMKLATELCRDNGQRVSVKECVRRVNQKLRDSGEYQYSLDVAPTDTDLDPVDDFLVNHKSGHCQYFASAAALMLQCVGIPARVVNGFKGTEHNPETEQDEVLQKHAHVWVEYHHRNRWNTIDPTPSARENLLLIPEDQGVLENVQKTVNNLWKNGINNVTPERQRAAIQPVFTVWNNIVSAVRRQGLAGAVHTFIDNVISDPSEWISLKGLIGSLFLFLTLAIALKTRLWLLIRSLTDWLHQRANGRRGTAKHTVRFYDNFQKTCARSGLKFPASNTARENAKSAEDYFQDKLTPDIQHIPSQIAEAFNNVRYGHQPLTPELVEHLNDNVILLTSALTATTPRQPK